VTGDLEIRGVGEPEVERQVAAVSEDDRIARPRVSDRRHCQQQRDVAVKQIV